MGLSNLPAEVLLAITEHLLASDVASLELCGNARLNYTLFQQHSVETFRYHPSRAGHIKVPSILGRLPHLKSISFKAAPGSFKSQIQGLDINTLSESLEELDLQVENAQKIFEEAVKALQGSPDFLPSLRRLTVLDTPPSRVLASNTIFRFPSNVEYVTLSFLNEGVKPPSCLKSLKVVHSTISTCDMAKDLEHTSIKSLSIPYIARASRSGVQPTLTLPPRLTKFELSHIAFQMPPELLPRCITSLSLGGWFELKDQTVVSLPDGLLHLTMAVFPQLSTDLLRGLPRTLQTLIVNESSNGSSIGAAKEDMHPNPSDWPPGLKRLKLQGKAWSDADIGAMPRSLLELELPFASSHLSSDFPCQLPPNLTSCILPSTIKLTEDNTAHFPRCLTFLDLKYNQKIKDKGISLLPRSLTHLDLSWNSLLTDYSSSDFPIGLVTLILNSVTQFTDKAIKHLPRSLTILSLNSAHQISGASFIDLPRDLIELCLPKAQFIVDSALKHLPRGLRTLNLDSATKISNNGISSLPRSLSNLHMTWNGNISDGAIVCMPRGLTELDLASAKISLKGLSQLPPCLTRLAVASSPYPPSDQVKSYLPSQLNDFTIVP